MVFKEKFAQKNKGKKINSLNKTYLANIDKPPSGQNFRSKITGKIKKNVYIKYYH